MGPAQAHDFNIDFMYCYMYLNSPLCIFLNISWEIARRLLDILQPGCGGVWVVIVCGQDHRAGNGKWSLTDAQGLSKCSPWASLHAHRRHHKDLPVRHVLHGSKQ